MADLELESLQDVQTLSSVRDALEHGKRLRGKSAKAIEFHLKAEALNNLARGQELADIRKFQRNSVHVLFDERSHSKLMEERSRTTKEEKLLERTENLSHEIKGFERKSNDYFIDKR